jgi:hypothetical protein
MKIVVLSALAFVTLVSTARADFLYHFDVNGANNIRAFSFSFASPTFVRDGTSLSFTPFTVTDGTNSWTMVQGRAPEPCFEFGTSGASLVNCGFVLPGTSSEGGFNLNILGGALPNATGAYFFDGEGSFLSKGDLNFVILNGSLTVSDTSLVPEPSSIALFGIAALAVAVKLGRRKQRWPDGLRSEFAIRPAIH